MEGKKQPRPSPTQTLGKHKRPKADGKTVGWNPFSMQKNCISFCKPEQKRLTVFDPEPGSSLMYVREYSTLEFRVLWFKSRAKAAARFAILHFRTIVSQVNKFRPAHYWNLTASKTAIGKRAKIFVMSNNQSALGPRNSSQSLNYSARRLSKFGRLRSNAQKKWLVLVLISRPSVSCGGFSGHIFNIWTVFQDPGR